MRAFCFVSLRKGGDSILAGAMPALPAVRRYVLQEMEPIRNRSGHAWKKIRERIMFRDCGLCQECKRNGVVTAGKEVDHIVPVMKGGGDEDSNLQLLCLECHKMKTRIDLGQKQRTRFDARARVVW